MTISGFCFIMFQESELKSKNQLVEELKIKANQTSPELLKLKDDLNEMKLSHRRELERAEQKTLTTEERYILLIFSTRCLLAVKQSF